MSTRWYYQLLVYVILILAVIITFGPFYWMIVSSIRPESMIFSSKLNLLPRPLTFDSYAKLFSKTLFLRWLFNSTIVASITTVLALFFSSLAGFAFAKYEFRGRAILFLIVLASVSIPQFVTIIPVFGLMVKIGLIDTYASLILPFSVNAFAIFLMRQYIITIPSDLLDCSRIDGCSEFQIYWRIILPVIKPAVGAAGIFVFLQTWSQYLWPLIMMRSREMILIPVGLASLKSVFLIEWGMIMAGAFLSTLPIIVAFLIFQQQFVAGLVTGSLKG